MPAPRIYDESLRARLREEEKKNKDLTFRYDMKVSKSKALITKLEET